VRQGCVSGVSDGRDRDAMSDLDDGCGDPADPDRDETNDRDLRGGACAACDRDRDREKNWRSCCWRNRRPYIPFLF
jgi:hypothetical protein